MRKLDLNQSISIFANIGVIVGLIFLGYEIRQNTAQMRADAGYSINEAVDALNSSIYQDKDFAALILRAEQSFNELERVDQARIASFYFSELNLADYISKLESEGMSDLHFDYVGFKVKQFWEMPGRREFVEQYVIPSEHFGSDELYRRLTLDPESE
jgi:hypothetical protein